MQNRGKIIGGMFGLFESRNLVDAELPAIFHGQQLQLATARGALTLLARTLKPGTVWLPSFLCPVVLPCFTSTYIRFFEIDEHLHVASRGWLEEVHPGDLVVFIDYFGFRSWDNAAAAAARRGAWIVEDACQALQNSQFSVHAHYIVTSPRKFVGVPDGGVLAAQGAAKPPAATLPPPPAPWYREALRASKLRAKFDLGHGDREWFQIFQRTEAEGPVEPARMSELSAEILCRAIDWPAVARQRRANYLYLSHHLRSLALFPELPDYVVPLGFPVRLAARDALRQALFAEEIYPPVHWSLADAVPSEFVASHRLSRQVMTLPCDQRYTEDDMERIVRCFTTTSISGRK